MKRLTLELSDEFHYEYSQWCKKNGFRKGNKHTFLTYCNFYSDVKVVKDRRKDFEDEK